MRTGATCPARKEKAEMAKPGYIQLAEHFGCSSEDVRDSAYQPGRFSKPVYSEGNHLYAAGAERPREFTDIAPRQFEKIESWTKHTIWRTV
jgi:hypothetical protein